MVFLAKRTTNEDRLVAQGFKIVERSGALTTLKNGARIRVCFANGFVCDSTGQQKIVR